MQRSLVVITRPVEQASDIQQRLQAAGVEFVCVPTLATQAMPSKSIPGLATRWDWLIFVSPAAVRHGLPMLYRADPLVPDQPVAATGPGTAKALIDAGFKAVLTAPCGGAQALLKTQELQAINGKKILMLAAPGGRKVLAETLTVRGATVRVFQCYQRMAPASGAAQLVRLLRNTAQPVITQSSSAGMRFMLDMLPAEMQEKTLALPLVVMSPRLARLARAMGFQHIINARRNTLDGFVEAIIETVRARTATRTKSKPE